MLIYHHVQGLIVIGAGGLRLQSSDVPKGRLRPLPPAILQVQGGNGLERQIVHSGEEPIPLPQMRGEVGNLVFLDTVLQRRVVHAN
ncbi:hypothetical protein SDC9_178874 [bioreactor metagenome]|uniref:Uncharacterized protein n=1 Tax=bioreactor metagenome TaxID=1076179 RepID=A0A645GYC9_9ZZZZ